jgi:hypothetical protein
MAALQEQAIEWLRGQKSMQHDPAFLEQASSFVPTIPLNPAGMPHCSACKSVLCGACGHCHRLDVVSFSRPDCPNDNDDMGAHCAAWYQALNAVWTVQRMNEESE